MTALLLPLTWACSGARGPDDDSGVAGTIALDLATELPNTRWACRWKHEYIFQSEDPTQPKSLDFTADVPHTWSFGLDLYMTDLADELRALDEEVDIEYTSGFVYSDELGDFKGERWQAVGDWLLLDYIDPQATNNFRHTMKVYGALVEAPSGRTLTMDVMHRYGSIGCQESI